MNPPSPPADFRTRLRQAAALPEAPARLDALRALASPQLGPLEVIQLDRELGRLLEALPATQPRTRLAVLSDATVDHLVPSLRVSALQRGLLLEVHVGGFGQVRSELLGDASPLQSFRPDFVLLSLTARDLTAGVPLGAGADEADRAVERALQDGAALWRAARERFGATVLQQNLLDTTVPVFGSLDRQVPGAPSRLIERFNARLPEACAAAGVTLLDVARPAAREGLAAFFDRGRWLQAKMEIAPAAALRYAELATRLVAAHRGLSRKCLVLDLDNTLWGGVIGDDGLEGIKLGEGSAVGEAHLALQRHAKQLSERGVILAVCSKNEMAIVERAFREHPEMALRLPDIAAMAVNWNDKSENLRSLARQLNIGLDSLVFVDDNPAERARVRESLPMVAVPELPADPAGYVDCIAQAGYFEAIAYTEEDRARARQYRAQADRSELLASAQSMDEFLAGLQMQVDFGPIGSIQLERATQLINKTNQFNTTTRRMGADEVRAYGSEAGRLGLQFRLVDRLGDNGLVSVILLRPIDAGTLQIDNWVMSCRVFGRQFEHEILNIVVEAARDRGASALEADFIPTGRNDVIRDLFPSLGFQPCGQAPSGDQPSRWRLALNDHQPTPTRISRSPQA